MSTIDVKAMARERIDRNLDITFASAVLTRLQEKDAEIEKLETLVESLQEQLERAQE